MIQILILLSVIFSLPSPGSAEEMTAEQCVSLALRENQVLKAQEMEVLSWEEGTKISRSDFYPAVKLQGRDIFLDREPKFTMKSNSLAAGIPPNDVDVEAGDGNFYGVSAMVEQTLFKGGQLTHSLRKSEILKEEAGHSLARQKKLLALEVKRAFGNAFREQYRRRILEKEVEFKKERLKILRERLQEGFVSREEVMVMETELGTSEEDLSKVKSREELALSRLKRLMYFPQDGEILLKAEPTKGVLRTPLSEVRGAALKNREELKMALARVSAAEEEIGVAKGQLLSQGQRARRVRLSEGDCGNPAGLLVFAGSGRLVRLRMGKDQGRSQEGRGLEREAQVRGRRSQEGGSAGRGRKLAGGQGAGEGGSHPGEKIGDRGIPI